MKHTILIILINLSLLLSFISTFNIVFGQDNLDNLNKSQLEIVKLKKEIMHLQKQIETTGNYWNLLSTYLIPILGGIFIAAASAYFAWQRERRIPPTAEQEKILETLVREWYLHSYLVIFHSIWNKIQQSNPPEDDKLVDEYWEKLCNKKFAIEKFSEELKESPKEKEDNLKKYLEKKLHLKRKEIDDRMDAIKNSADVEYYDKVVRDLLPSVVEIAVSSIIDPKILKYENYEVWVNKSLKVTKRLMIFYRLREDKKIIDTLIRSNINKKILESDKIKEN